MNDFEKWIESSDSNTEKEFRRVVHIILNAISSHHDLRAEMIMKGGILVAIAYHTGRYTRDIDFSTPRHYSEFKNGEKEFIANIGNAINLSSANLPYGLACNIQKSEVRPGTQGNYQTLHLSIGYAKKSDERSMKKLASGQAAQVVKIDYSFNELVGDLGLIDLGGEEKLQTYGLLTLISEKYRALIQQGGGEGKRVRGSSRGQDIYDLNSILKLAKPSFEAQEHLVQLLIDKARSRDVDASRSSMSDDEVYSKSKVRYEALKDEIDGDLPDFDEAFSFVKGFYESLPWPNDKK